MKKLIALSIPLALSALLCLAVPQAARAGATNGPIVHRDSVEAHGTDQYTIRFDGGEEATIWVSGDGDTDLDLYVYDENGNLIAKDDDDTDECIVSFTPRWTGRFTVRIVNRGRVYNDYVMRTD